MQETGHLKNNFKEIVGLNENKVLYFLTLCFEILIYIIIFTKISSFKIALIL